MTIKPNSMCWVTVNHVLHRECCEAQTPTKDLAEASSPTPPDIQPMIVADSPEILEDGTQPPNMLR